MSSIDYKRLHESLKSARFRAAVRKALREARTATLIQPRTVQVPALTPNQIDRLMHRRIEREQAIRDAAAALLAKKKKLPLPVFACENTGDEQVRPRVLVEDAS